MGLFNYKDANKLLNKYNFYLIGGGAESLVIGVNDENSVIKISDFDENYLKNRKGMEQIKLINKMLSKLGNKRVLFFSDSYSGHLFVKKDNKLIKLVITIQELITGYHFNNKKELINSKGKKLDKIKFINGVELKDNLFSNIFSLIDEQFRLIGENENEWIDSNPLNFIINVNKEGLAKIYYIDGIQEGLLLFKESNCEISELLKVMGIKPTKKEVKEFVIKKIPVM